MKNSKNIFSILLLLLIISSFLTSFVLAQETDEDEDLSVFSLEVEKLVAMLNAWIATFLFVVAFIAYKRDKRKRLLWVSLAFLLFAIKSFLIASQLIFPDIDFVDPLAVALEFGVLLSFFYGVLKK